jgi:hypothetical protein
VKPSINYPLHYGLARLHARVSDLPTEVEWSALHAVAGFGPFLDAARKGPLAGWLSGLDTHSGPHDIERKLRHRFGFHIEELTHWLPHRWHPCLRWLGFLPYLEIFAYLQRQGEESRWMREDMSLFPYLAPVPSGVRPAGQRAAITALPDTWIDGWQQRLPEGEWRDQRARAKFGGALLGAAGVTANQGGSDSRQLQGQRMALLRRLFHRHSTSPVAALAYLGLVLVALNSLRAELQQRLLFPVQGVGL